MKTLKELTEMISKYESKWGKLGHTNIMNPELNHSGIDDNTKKGENKTMSRMNNDLIAFRQKVAAGKERNKLVHRSTIDVNSLNKMNYEQLMDSHTLIHAQNPLYGQQNPNAKYYKREGEPGKYRYYYTKEEYDAAHKQGSASTEANREAQERQQYENNKKAVGANIGKGLESEIKKPANNGPSKFNNMRADVVNEYAKIAREASSKDAAKAFYDMAKGGDEAIDELYSTIQEGFKSGKLSYKDGRFETDDDQLREDIEAFSDNIQKFAKQIGEASGKGREIQDELEKLMVPDIEAMSKKAEGRKDNAKNAQSGREAAESKSASATKEAKEANERKEKKEAEKAERNNQNKRSQPDQTYDGSDLANALKRNTDESLVNKLGRLMGSLETAYHKEFDKGNDEAGSKGWDKYFEERDKFMKENGIEFGSPEYEEAAKIADQMWEEYQKTFDSSKKNYLNRAKHSTSGKALITNSAMGDELMDEYSAFQAKVKAGKERNRLAHSTTISPAELNSRYEKELESKGILVHGGNYKYYNKIDMPNGNTRYFYTKEEWDAYNQPKKTTVTLVADKKPHNNGSLEATKKYHQEKAKAAEEEKKAPYKNAVKEAGNVAKNPFNDIWRSQEKTIKEKIKSRSNDMEDLAKKYDMNHPFSKNFDDKLEDIYKNWQDNLDEKGNKLIEKYGDEDNVPEEEIANFTKEVLTKDYKKFEEAIDAELDKQEASYKALADAGKAWEKFDIAWDEIKELSKFDKQVLAEEMGLDSFDEEDILKKYYVVEDDKAWREAHKNDEDYGKAEFEKTAEGLNSFWNDYKAAKKALGHSAMDDDESLSHAGNYKYYNKIDLPNGTTRYFYTKAEWDAYREGNDRSKYEQQKKNFENNKKAAEAEGDRYKKPEQKPLPKSATMTDEERKEMYEGLTKKAKIHNQQVKNFENNKKAAEHEGDRWNKSKSIVKDLDKKDVKTPKDAETPEAPKMNEIPKEIKEEAKVEVKEQETRDINKEMNDYANNVVNNVANDPDINEYGNNWGWGEAFGRSQEQADELNKYWEKYIVPKIEATLEEAYSLYGEEYAILIDNLMAQQINNLKEAYKANALNQRLLMWGW